jgi:hypothetical protein
MPMGTARTEEWGWHEGLRSAVATHSQVAQELEEHR